MRYIKSKSYRMGAVSSDILFKLEKPMGIITLNRPQTLNALTFDMIKALRSLLLAWLHNREVQIVVLQSSNEKAFCAGGDLRSVYDAHRQKEENFLDQFFREEYTLNYLIHEYPKPIISFINGIAMGGGLGLSVHGAYRVVSETSLIAMPETNIGYFPDVGATAFFQRPPGAVGLYLGLTGSPLKAGDALYTNLATHYIPTKTQHYVMEALKKEFAGDLSQINGILSRFAISPPASSLEKLTPIINEHFTKTTLVDLIRSLKESNHLFAKETLLVLEKRSPTSLFVTFDQLQRGKTLTSFAEVMSLEFTLSSHFLKGHDFLEGIRAVIIDKDKNPHWRPKSLEDTSLEEIAAYFVPDRPPLSLEVI